MCNIWPIPSNRPITRQKVRPRPKMYNYSDNNYSYSVPTGMTNYEGRSISSRTIFLKTTVASRKTFLPLFNMSLGKLTQRSKRFTSRHEARGTEISVSDAEEVQNACC